MGDYPGSSDPGRFAASSGSATNPTLALSEQIEILRHRLEERFADFTRPDRQISPNDIQMLHTQTTIDLEALLQHLLATGSGNTSSREVSLEAELQAERQQLGLLRKSLQDKDRRLSELTEQCQRLEDALEDRNRDIDHLNQEIENAQTGLPPLNLDARDEPRNRSNTHDHAAVRGDDLKEIYRLASPPKYHIPWRTIGISLVGVVVLVLLGVIGKILWSQRPETPQPTHAATSPRPAVHHNAPPPDQPVEAPAPKVVHRPVVIVKDHLQSGGVGPDLIQLAAGHFTMGSNSGLSSLDERPAHEVALKMFYISSHEITFAEYERFARIAGRSLPDDAGFGRGDHPIINVSWDDAQAYVYWLSTETNKNYRLPSEAEWEYAARAGTTGYYWWGHDAEPGRAVCFDCGTPWDNRGTAPVGSLDANPFGLFDTSGNVMEWIQDCYHRNYDNAPTDGSAWLDGSCEQRVVRGGAFNKPIASARNNTRYQLQANTRLNMLGFRIVRD